MTNVAGHLREQNGMYQMILSWKDTDGKRRTKSISTGLPVKGNKKRAESLLRKTQKEFNPETMQQVSDLPVSEYLNRWLRESVMNLPPETYGRYAYDLGRTFPDRAERVLSKTAASFQSMGQLLFPDHKHICHRFRAEGSSHFLEASGSDIPIPAGH